MSDSRRRVFHIISHFDMGGAERIAASIAQSGNPAIDYHIVEVVRAHSAFTPTFIAELRSSGIVCHRAIVPDVRFHFIFERVAAATFPLWFLFLFLRYKPVAIHTHTEVPDMATFAFFSLFPFLKKRCRIVRTIHNTRLWTGQKKMGRTIERFFIRNRSNIAISRAVQESYADVYGEMPPIVYNGVPPASAHRVGQSYGAIVKGKTNILFAGRFEEQKGIATLLSIIETVDPSRYHFHLFGSGSLHSLIESRVGSRPNVSLNAPLHDLRSIMPLFQFLLMPSEFEGLSTLSIEASLEGLPVIANRCPGLEETLPPDWPLAVSHNALPQYERLFASLLPSIDRQALAAQALRYAEDNFSLSRMRQSYEALYINNNPDDETRS